MSNILITESTNRWSSGVILTLAADNTAHDGRLVQTDQANKTFKKRRFLMRKRFLNTQRDKAVQEVGFYHSRGKKEFIPMCFKRHLLLLVQ